MLGAATDGALTTKVSLSDLPSWGLVSGNICSARVIVVCEYVCAYMCAPLEVVVVLVLTCVHVCCVC